MIYNLKDVLTIDKPEFGSYAGGINVINFKLLCHTSHGDPNDEHGRFFEAGKWYNANLEFHDIKKDTNYEEFRSCWVSYNDRFGSRFTMKGNIYSCENGKGYWDHFSVLFCTLSHLRDIQINSILDEDKNSLY